MPNLKSLKALKKLMQEEGLLKQVEKMAPLSETREVPSRLKEALETKKLIDGPLKGVKSIDNVLNREKIGDVIKDARAIRNRDELINNYDIDEKLANYPSKNLEDNIETRKLFRDQESLKEYSPNDWERIRALLEKSKFSK